MKGLTSNKMKIIAIILMVLDHIGYYFVSYISDEMFNSLRFVGRIAMPIFAFLLVQGFFNTKSDNISYCLLNLVINFFSSIL